MYIAICEDDAKERNLLKIILKEYYEGCEIYEFDNGLSLLEYLKSNIPDIVLLDIEMPGINGIETSKKIRGDFPELNIIFITSHPQFALEAFGVYAFDYILKPLDRVRLINSLNMLGKSKQAAEASILIHNRGISFRVKHKDIVFIEKIYNKCIVYTDKFTYSTVKSLNYFEKELDKEVFVKTHKAFIVNRSRIKSIVSLGNQTYEIHFDCIDKTAILSRGANEKLKLV